MGFRESSGHYPVLLDELLQWLGLGPVGHLAVGVGLEIGQDLVVASGGRLGPGVKVPICLHLRFGQVLFPADLPDS